MLPEIRPGRFPDSKGELAPRATNVKQSLEKVSLEQVSIRGMLGHCPTAATASTSYRCRGTNIQLYQHHPSGLGKLRLEQSPPSVSSWPPKTCLSKTLGLPRVLMSVVSDNTPCQCLPKATTQQN